MYDYLMLINDADLSVSYALRDGSWIAGNENIQKLLAALPQNGRDEPVLPEGVSLYVEVADQSGTVLEELSRSFTDYELPSLNRNRVVGN